MLEFLVLSKIQNISQGVREVVGNCILYVLALLSIVLGDMRLRNFSMYSNCSSIRPCSTILLIPYLAVK